MVRSATRTSSRRWRLGWIIWILVALGIAVAFGSSRFGGSSQSQPAAISIGSDPPNATPAPTTTAPTYVIPAETTPPTTDDGVNPFGGNSREDKRMPDVICMNLQDAQNEIQDHGVFLSKSVDATGKGRRQILDRNWIVVDQQPRVGEKIGEGEAVLSVVKKDEPNDCS